MNAGAGEPIGKVADLEAVVPKLSCKCGLNYALNNGTITVSGSLSATTAGSINGGTLLLGASNVLNDAASVTLGGGTLATGGFSETLGALTLTANSTIDFGAGNTSVLSFSGAT